MVQPQALMRPISPVILLLVTLASNAHSELLELSYKYNVNAPTYPSNTPFTFEVQHKDYIAHGIWLETNDFCTSEHSGTHVDAPAHFAIGGWFVDEILLDRLWNVPGVLVDVSQAVEKSSTKNYAIQVKDLEEWEEKHGLIPDGAVVLFRTGWGNRVNDTKSYTGVDENNVAHFPGLGGEAASWLANYGERRGGYAKGIVAVGIDTSSIDVGNSTVFPSHVTLYRRNIYGIENMANLGLLPAIGFNLTILPMRIGRGSGAPSRIIAMV